MYQNVISTYSMEYIELRAYVEKPTHKSNFFALMRKNRRHRPLSVQSFYYADRKEIKESTTMK